MSTAPTHLRSLPCLPTLPLSARVAANVHYITGKTFSGWVRESGLQAGEQVRMKKDGARVLIQRVPSDRKASRTGCCLLLLACCWL